MSIEVSPDGYKWYAESDDDHLALGGHEVELGPILASFADQTKSYLNVGAHVGTWSIRMAKFFNRVWAIEANPNTLMKLVSNVHLNNLDNNVIAVHRAFWDEDDRILSLVDANGMSTGGSTRVQVGDGDLLVQTSTVDSYFKFPGRPTFGLISMDVEGAEAHVLRGATETIERDRPHLVIELHEGHPGVDEDLNEQVYSVLRDLNYSVSLAPVGVETMLICTPAESFTEEVLPSPVLQADEEDGMMLLRNLFER